MPLFTRSRQLPTTDKDVAEAEAADTADAETTNAAESADAPEATEATEATDAPDATEGEPDEAVAAGGWRDRYPQTARAVAWVTTAVAASMVFVALLMPNHLARVTPGAFTRIPVEALCGAAILLVLPPRPRRVAAVLAGVGLGLLTIVNFLDMGFYTVLDRPFNLVLDWILFDDGEEFLRASVGGTGTVIALAVIVVLVIALLVLMTLAVVRLTRLLVRHSAATAPATLVLVTVWVTCAALGTQIADIPVASRNTAVLVQDRAKQVRAGIKDEQSFAKVAAVDSFRDTPPDQLLTGLRGKNVIFAFVESYGRSALEDPAMGPQVGATLADGTSRLKAAGFSSRSGFLTSPTTGAGSWLAHSTFMSGLWAKNEQRYRTLTASDRLTLTGAFGRSGAWRTVGVMPGVTRAWPEGQFYDFDKIYDSRQLGYKGPKFSWTPVPDQYTLSAFERLEHSKKGSKPLMAGIILASSHNPWAPIPEMIGWDEVGDGSVYNGIKEAGKDPKEVWKDADQVRTEYRRAIEYSVNSLVSYVEKYGDEDTVLVFLGDHQPVPTVTEGHFGRDVPISIVARDPAVLEKMSDWGWQDGLKPGPDAPVSRMDTFRDRFLTTYGPKP